MHDHTFFPSHNHIQHMPKHFNVEALSTKPSTLNLVACRELLEEQLSSLRDAMDRLSPRWMQEVRLRGTSSQITQQQQQQQPCNDGSVGSSASSRVNVRSALPKGSWDSAMVLPLSSGPGADVGVDFDVAALGNGLDGFAGSGMGGDAEEGVLAVTLSLVGSRGVDAEAHKDMFIRELSHLAQTGACVCRCATPFAM
jgi:hypothetical protein